MKDLTRIMKYPCCNKEKIVLSEINCGWISAKCPKCGKFVRFDLSNFTAIVQGPIRGLNNKQSTD